RRDRCRPHLVRCADALRPGPGRLPGRATSLRGTLGQDGLMPRIAQRPLGLAWGLLVGLAAALLLGGIAGAQTPSSAEWAFAPRGIFADARVIHSMQIQMALDSV